MEKKEISGGKLSLALALAILIVFTISAINSPESKANYDYENLVFWGFTVPPTAQNGCGAFIWNSTDHCFTRSDLDTTTEEMAKSIVLLLEDTSYPDSTTFYIVAMQANSTKYIIDP